MPAALAKGYKSLPQRARLVRETWVAENRYCPARDRDVLEQIPTSVKIADFRCDRRGEKLPAYEPKPAAQRGSSIPLTDQFSK